MLITNDIEAPKALDVQLRGLHIEPSEANCDFVAILHGGKKDYRQYWAHTIWWKVRADFMKFRTDLSVKSGECLWIISFPFNFVWI